MTQHANNTPEQVPKFVPKEKAQNKLPQVDEAGQAIVAQIRTAADLAREASLVSPQRGRENGLVVRMDDKMSVVHRWGRFAPVATSQAFTAPVCLLNGEAMALGPSLTKLARRVPIALPPP